MWRIPQDILDSRDDERAIRFVLDQLEHPDRFVAKVQELYSDPGAESFDVLEFKDGRIFERYSQPQRIGDESVGRVWSFRDVTEQKRSERKLEQLANQDALTGLLNRRRFEEELERVVAHAGRYQVPAAALVLDLDNFKYVNDTLGHRAGDHVIKSVAALLRGRLRRTDVLARLGGDEFAIVLPLASEHQAEKVALDLLGAIRHHKVLVDGSQISMTVSIGVALLTDAIADPDQLLTDADLAMYRAKQAGRDGISVHGPAKAQEARLEASYTWVQRLRLALEQEQFVLQGQPIVEIESGRTCQYELLLRIRDEDGALSPPSAFLPTAERVGFVQAIDRWVVGRAIELIATGARQGHRLCLEVNLSGKSIGDVELTRMIGDRISTANIDPSCLILEVTETAAIADMQKARTFAHALSELGCQFALDDFGAGFGSFYYLKHLPLDYIKIDGDFIAQLVDSKIDRVVVKAIVDIARSLSKKTIAEFVTDERTLHLLQKLGVDYAQGDYVGKPVAFEELALA